MTFKSPALFESTEAFTESFTRRLLQINDSSEVGVLILVLANATTLPPLFRQIMPDLLPRLEYFKRQLSDSAGKARESAAIDDLSVFEQISDSDLRHFPLTQLRSLGRWQLQFNQLRSLRPARQSAAVIDDLYQPFNPQGFHFNKPFLDKEVLWQGSFANSRIKLLFNKFPFADYHGLMVFEPAQNRAQYLSESQWLEAWQLIQQLEHLKGWGMAYNSLGAYASVNHQHWQTFVSQAPYPVESTVWQHNGGIRSYPLTVQSISCKTEAWSMIDECQKSHTAFNLLLRPGKLYLARRLKQGHYEHSEWTSGFAWSEVMGRFTATRKQDFLQLTTTDLEQELARLEPV